MKKLKLSFLVAGLAISISAPIPAQAASKATILTKAFQKYLTDGEVNYSKAMDLAKNLFEPKIAAAESKIVAARTQFRNVNQATVIMVPTRLQTDFLNYMSVLKCPDNSYCGGVGAVTSIIDFTSGDQAFMGNDQMNLGILQIVDLGVSNGLFKLSTPIEYNNVANTLRAQSQNLVTLTQQYRGAQSSASSDRDYIQSMQPTIDTAILSAKRANTNLSIFDKAFVTSLKFEYNAKRLDELARDPWTYITSLKALSDAVSVTKSSMQADAVSARYSYSSAANINAIYGNLFLSEWAFTNSFKTISGIYKSATGVTLSRK